MRNSAVLPRFSFSECYKGDFKIAGITLQATLLPEKESGHADAHIEGPDDQEDRIGIAHVLPDQFLVLRSETETLPDMAPEITHQRQTSLCSGVVQRLYQIVRIRRSRVVERPFGPHEFSVCNDDRPVLSPRGWLAPKDTAYF